MNYVRKTKKELISIIKSLESEKKETESDEISNTISYFEQQKLNSEEVFDIIQLQAEGIGFVDKNEIFRFANNAALNIFECDSLIGVSLYSLIAPNEIETLEHQTRNRYNGISNNYEITIKTLKSNTKILSVSSAPKFDKSGNYKGAYAIFSDITQRRYEQELIKTESSILSNLIINLKEGILLESSDRKIRLTNQLFCEMFGIPVSPEAMVGADCSNAAEQSKMLFSNPEKFAHDIEIILKNKQAVFNDELELADGRYFERDYIPTYIDGNYSGHLWKYRDITQKKLSDIQLKKIYQAVEQSPVMTMITNLDGIIEYVNPAFTKVSGFCSEDVLGKNPRILSSGEKTTEEYQSLWQTISSGKEWRGEFHNKRKNGELYWAGALISPMVDSSGKISHYIAVEEDITLRKTIENELLELNANLENKIAERTRLLNEANKKLENDIAKRIMIEKDLRWNKSLLELMSNSSPLGFLVVDNRTDEILYFNHRFCQIWDIEHIETQMHRGELKNNDIIPYCLPVLADIPAFAESCKPLQLEENRITIEDEIQFTNNRTVRRFSTQIRGENDEYYGRFYIFEDISPRKQAELFERELLSFSIQMTKIPYDEMDVAIHDALFKIGKMLSADRAYVFEINPDNLTMSNTYEWCEEGVNPEIENLKNIPVEIFPEWMKTLERHETIIIPSVGELPESWLAEREILEPQGIQSLIAIPILSDNNLIGFIGLDSVKSKKQYQKSEINNLKVWSNMLAGILIKQRSNLMLNQTRENYELFFNSIDEFMFVLDESGRIIHTNDVVKNRLGYSSDELFEHPVLFIHPENRRDEADRIVHDMLTGKAEFCPIPLVAKNGKMIPVETRVKKGYWNNKPVIFGVSKDMSSIMLSEEKFAKAFHSNSALMAISSYSEGVFIDVNEAFLNTLNFKRDEIIGQPSFLFNFFQNKNLRNEIISQIEENKPVKDIEIIVNPKTGTQITGLFSAEVIYIGENKCLLTLIIDITDRKRAEEQIRLARLEAIEANNSKSEFLSRMSHELRTPLNSILGFAQLLEMSELNQSQSRGVFHILQSGRHLLGLINEILDISRIESGRLSLNIEPVRIKSVVNEMIDIVNPLAFNKNINVIFNDTFENDYSINTDSKSLKQIILNLLNNAIKYNTTGGRVVIDTEVCNDTVYKNRYLKIAISDNGFGIKESDLPKLFTPFERIGVNDIQIEGTGLGLAVVKKLTEAMGGEVGVESKINEGSTFWVKFPLSAKQITGNIKEIVPGACSESSFVKGTILYIEDNLSNIELIDQILTDQRPEIKLISNNLGKNALGLAIKNKPDLILLDLNLPDLNGSEVLGQLQTNEITCKIPVIIVSADGMQQKVDKLLKEGARNYITKPLEVSDFLKIVDKFLQNK